MTVITLLASFMFSLTAYSLTSSLIPRLSSTLISAGLKGKDLLKGNSTGGGGFPISNQPTTQSITSPRSPSKPASHEVLASDPTGSIASNQSDEVQFMIVQNQQALSPVASTSWCSVSSYRYHTILISYPTRSCPVRRPSRVGIIIPSYHQDLVRIH